MKYTTLSLALGLSTLTLTHSASANDNKASANATMATSIPDLRNEKDVKTKKRKFFNALRPMVEKEN
jgi:Bax protein